MVGFFVVLVIVIFCLWFYFSKLKIPKLRNIVFIDGTLGSGKSGLSVTLAVRLYRKRLRVYKVLMFLKKIHFIGLKNKHFEEPILYSNIHLRYVKYTPLTKDLITRQNFRFAYKSVVLIDEFSLVADQNMYGNKYAEVCERMSEFFKLFRHETKGGTLILNSQSTSDLNYTLKSVLSDYLYIHHKTGRFFPFFCIYKVQECSYSRDKNFLQINDGDIEDKLKSLWTLKKYYKMYDTYCHSIFTDNLPIYSNTLYNDKKDSLKTDNMITYKDMIYLYENIRKEENTTNVQKN